VAVEFGTFGCRKTSGRNLQAPLTESQKAIMIVLLRTEPLVMRLHLFQLHEISRPAGGREQFRFALNVLDYDRGTDR